MYVCACRVLSSADHTRDSCFLLEEGTCSTTLLVAAGTDSDVCLEACTLHAAEQTEIDKLNKYVCIIYEHEPK